MLHSQHTEQSSTRGQLCVTPGQEVDRFCPAELTSLASTTKNVQVNITSFTVNNNLVSAPQPVCTSQVSGLDV